MKNYIQPGESIEIVASEAFSSGEGVLMGKLFGVASKSVESGEKLNIGCTGVYALAKKTGSGKEFAVGDHVHFDSSEKKCDTSGGEVIGICVEDAGTSATEVKVKLA